MDNTKTSSIVAIFDLDGTLYTGHIAHGITRHHKTHRVKRLPLYFYMTTHMAMWPLWRLGLLSEVKVRELWVRHLGWTVRGWTHKEAATAFAWIAEHYVQPLVRPDVMKRVWDHQAVGHRIILVSGTPAHLLAEIGRQLGIEETVGTPLLLRAGCYTGACELPVCQGLGKVSRLETYLGDDSITWSHSYGYADSYTDLPLLERVGYAVAVYPDDELTTHARSQGWEIIGDVNHRQCISVWGQGKVITNQTGVTTNRTKREERKEQRWETAKWLGFLARNRLIEVYRSPADPTEHKKTAHYQIQRDTVAEVLAKPRSSVKHTNVFPDDGGWR